MLPKMTSPSDLLYRPSLILARLFMHAREKRTMQESIRKYCFINTTLILVRAPCLPVR
jgi:hypothetical protein